MGFRICYFASRLPAIALASSLNLEVGEKVQEFPDGEGWVAGLKNSGWSILWSEDETFGSRSERLLATSSVKADLIHCEANETCMWSSAVFWSDGRPRWTVTHAGDGENIYDLSTDGELPEPFEDIKNKHFVSQKQDADVDHIFEIPLELAKFFTGFRHDTYLEPDDVDAFHIVRAQSKTGFFSKFLVR